MCVCFHGAGIRSINPVSRERNMSSWHMKAEESGNCAALGDFLLADK